GRSAGVGWRGGRGAWVAGECGGAKRLTRNLASGTSSWTRSGVRTVKVEREMVGSERGRDEWLEPDGLGGFASGTVSGIRTRRYHALLLTATMPPSRPVP